MSLAAPSEQRVSGAGLRFGVVAARFNESLVDALLARFQATLQAAGVRDRDITLLRVPGSHELPWAVGQLATQRQCDCVVALGVLIGGDTNHHELVGQSVSHALQRVALDSGVPVINGVIVTNALAQARARCGGRINRGAEFGQAALTMAALNRRFRKKS